MLETVKKHKGKLLLAGIITLLPMAAGVLLWDRLPERMATHWGFDGQPDGWSPRWLAVFGLPLLLLVFNWICLLGERRNFARNPKPMWLVFWICPAVSLFAGMGTYAYALGMDLALHRAAPVMAGLLLIVVGNYLPKCRQNRTLGIKIKWTLESEENWNATHRMAGKVWVAAGGLLLPCVFLPEAAAKWVVLPVLFAAVLIPVAYSYGYSRKDACGKDDKGGK